MKYIVAFVLAIACLAAFAGIEKVAVPTESGLKLIWWPKVAPPKGWHFDQGSSYYFAFNAMTPDGSTFSKAETVRYAKADYKPRLAPASTLSVFINDDIAFFKKEQPNLVIIREPSTHTEHGLLFQLVFYHPTAGTPGNWEQVAYSEDGAYFLTFVVSSRTQHGLEAAMPAFRSLISNYIAGP